MVKQERLLGLGLAVMVKQDYQIIACNGEARPSARADPCVIPDLWL